MPDALAVIDRVILEHRRIRGDLKQAGTAVADIETLFALHQASAGWSQSSLKEITDKQGELLNGVNVLWQGLRKHFAFEEKALPGVMEPDAMKTILEDHKKIAAMVSRIQTTLGEGFPETADQPEMLNRKALIQENIQEITQAIEEHWVYEEQILNKMKKELEAKIVRL